MVVIPLLFETQAETHFEQIICVACSAGSQMKRLKARGWSSEQIAQRIAAQMPVAEKMSRSHHVIWTEGVLRATERQVEQIVARLR